MIFSLSFLVALTGAMSPGPLLTYTIIKSVKTSQRGYLMGLWIITGHALLEMCVIVLLLYGFSFFLQNVIVVRAIGIIGGILLIAFGSSIMRNVYRGNISTDFMDEGAPSGEGELIKNPVLGGFMISMANPYWWVWWATIGFAFMIQFEISFQDWSKLIAFFLGHEAGDLIWYLTVSILSFWGIRRLNKKAYYGILYCCGLFMILFGLYLGISPFFKAT
ncbi:MAG: LysE family translocator [Desulfobacterales bacterium]|nr:LysE family translocator [Desulfobacterales bacterium]